MNKITTTHLTVTALSAGKESRARAVQVPMLNRGNVRSARRNDIASRDNSKYYGTSAKPSPKKGDNMSEKYDSKIVAFMDAVYNETIYVAPRRKMWLNEKDDKEFL